MTRKELTPTERLAKIAAIVETASKRTGKLGAVLLNDSEVLGVYLLACAAPE